MFYNKLLSYGTLWAELSADQLTAAQSVVNGQPSVSNYQLAVTYGNWGKISGYNLTQTDLQNNVTTQASRSMTYPGNANSLGNSQTMFAPTTQNGVEGVDFTFGINGSLRKREVQHPTPYTEYYLFNSQANLKAYSNNGLDFAYYGYNAANTRSYKLSMLNQNQWVNGQPEPIHLQLQSAMFYPNAYINFNQNGEYTKHYYNGSERICSRLGENTVSIAANSNDRLGFRIMQADQQARADLLEVVEAGDVPIETPSVDVTTLQVSGTPDDIFYYHTNHLGSTAFVTDQNQNVTQGFLYAPFGEITTEFNANFGNDIIPKYSFNAKELDEETGMYYYEARYYKPPVFTSRDAMFEKYFWMTPYAYCANNPVKYVDPDGEELIGALIGAAVKATMEITSQTISNGFANLENGKGFFNNWGKNIDWMDVGISAVEGLADGIAPGLGKTAKLAIEGGSMVLKSAVDLKGSEENEGKITFTSVVLKSKDRHKNWGNFGIDLAGEIFSFAVGKAANIDDIPSCRSNFSDCILEAGFKGVFSGSFGTPFKMLEDYYKQNRKKKSSSNESENTTNERRGIVNCGPLILVNME